MQAHIRSASVHSSHSQSDGRRSQTVHDDDGSGAFASTLNSLPMQAVSAWAPAHAEPSAASSSSIYSADDVRYHEHSMSMSMSMSTSTVSADASTSTVMSLLPPPSRGALDRRVTVMDALREQSAPPSRASRCSNASGSISNTGILQPFMQQQHEQEHGHEQMTASPLITGLGSTDSMGSNAVVMIDISAPELSPRGPPSRLSMASIRTPTPPSSSASSARGSALSGSNRASRIHSRVSFREA